MRIAHQAKKYKMLHYQKNKYFRKPSIYIGIDDIDDMYKNFVFYQNYNILRYFYSRYDETPNSAIENYRHHVERHFLSYFIIKKHIIKLSHYRKFLLILTKLKIYSILKFLENRFTNIIKVKNINKTINFFDKIVLNNPKINKKCTIGTVKCPINLRHNKEQKSINICCKYCIEQLIKNNSIVNLINNYHLIPLDYNIYRDILKLNSEMNLNIGHKKLSFEYINFIMNDEIFQYLRKFIQNNVIIFVNCMRRKFTNIINFAIKNEVYNIETIKKCHNLYDMCEINKYIKINYLIKACNIECFAKSNKLEMSEIDDIFRRFDNYSWNNENVYMIIYKILYKMDKKFRPLWRMLYLLYSEVFVYDLIQ